MLNNVVRAGVLDTRMGRMKNGKHTGGWKGGVRGVGHYVRRPHRLEEDVNNYEGEEAEQVRESLNFAREMWEDAKDCKRTPGKKTFLETLSVGAEWGGAAAVGLAGAETGAAIGLVGGPIGGVVGAVTGGVIGAVVGSEMGASAVQNF
ncbi:hypothetical protein Q1695_011247 [Nippostrongylus brasiliensis]|nr:hypothetical protein Q1695_011247 [Nippostrongylus brasiliensis]